MIHQIDSKNEWLLPSASFTAKLGLVFDLKLQSCKLYNNKYMIVSTQIKNTEIFAFLAVLLFKLLSPKVLFRNNKDNRKEVKNRLLFKKILNSIVKLLQNHK